MSDPGLFPVGPLPGSNAIGQFQIGVSQVGSIPFPWQKTVISQYANSKRLLNILASFAAYMDQSENLDNFFDKMWNIETAEGYGLDVWGRIVGLNGRALTVDSGQYLGFEEAEDEDLQGFNQQPFYSGPPTTDNYLLTDDAYRQLILAKAAANICDGSIPAINALLMNLFPGRGNAYVQEGSGIDEDYLGFAESGPGMAVGFNQEPFYAGQAFTTAMHMRYVFDFGLTPVELAIVNQSGVLPTPTGVKATIVINP